MAAAFAPGALTAGIFLNVGDYLTGAVTGLPSDLPWALPYFGEMQHPAALYRAAGLIAVLLAVLWQLDSDRPQATIYLALLGWGLVHLVADAFVANAPLLGPLRLSQALGLLGCAAGAHFGRWPCWPSRDKPGPATAG